MNDSEQWEKEFDRWFLEYVPNEMTLAKKAWKAHYGDETEDRTDIKSFIRTLIAQQKTLAREETAKAYGGCEYCYGKGYGTETIYHGDARTRVIGEKYVPCPKCERGKQIAELLASKEGGK